MKNLVYLLLPLFFSFTIYAEKINLQSGDNSVTIVENKNDYVLIEYKIKNFETQPVVIGGNTYYNLFLEKHSNIFEKGDPALPLISRSLIIPDDKGVQVELLESELETIQLPVAPSKGIIYRDQDPESVPYEFSGIYQKNDFYPADQAGLGDPYILRDFRGVNIKVYPFRYNPVKQELQVLTRMLVKVSFEGKGIHNVKIRKDNNINQHFKAIYKDHFLNYDDAKYPMVGEVGRMIVISWSNFINDIIPYKDWKIEKGIQTNVYDVSAIGANTTSILNFIQSEYNLGNGLTFVQFVGDAAQIPTFTFLGGGSDPTYSVLDGSDDYPDIIIGRFSAETSAEVQTQVERTIHYERDLNTGTWLYYGTGIASEQGAGFGWNGLADWEHMDVLRTRLLNFN
ncbi:MAG: hypothetical protein K8R53_12470, partial [Bacteroidales bacterium]|nr:hypothetical protein [Bacteroidales bacterium]